MAWDSVNQGRWRQAFFPTNYETDTEMLHFVLAGQEQDGQRGNGQPKTLGVWRSHFKAPSAMVDPGAIANATTNTSFLVRESDLQVDVQGHFAVSVGPDDIVTVSTRVEGVPSIAPVIPVPAQTEECQFPRQLSDDFDGLSAGQEAKYFQGLHGAFEAVSAPKEMEVKATTPKGKDGDQDRGMVLRQMAVGLPVGFHSTDKPPLTVVGAQLSAATQASAGVDFFIEPPTSAAQQSTGMDVSAVLGLHVSTSGSPGVFLQVSGSGQWWIGAGVTETATPASWKSGAAEVSTGTWHRVQMNVTNHDRTVRGWVDGKLMFEAAVPSSAKLDLSSPGWTGIGTGGWGPVLFDSFEMHVL